MGFLNNIFDGVKKFFTNPIESVKRVGSSMMDGLRVVNDKVLKPALSVLSPIAPAIGMIPGVGTAIASGIGMANKASGFLDKLG